MAIRTREVGAYSWIIFVQKLMECLTIAIHSTWALTAKAHEPGVGEFLITSQGHSFYSLC
jgi:hypothetical protein